MRMGMGVIRTDVGEDAMRAEVHIDDGDDIDDGDGAGTKLGMGKGRVPAEVRTLRPHPGKHFGEAIPSVYLYADDNQGDDNTGAVPSHATKNLGLVVAHAARSVVERNDTDKDLVLSDNGLEGALPLSPRPPFECIPEPVRKGRVKPKPKPKAKAKARAKLKAKANAPAIRAKKACYEYTDEDYDQEEDVYKDPSAFVPSVTVYRSSSDDGDADVDMLMMDPSRMELNEDDGGADVDMDVDRIDTKLQVKTGSKKKVQQKNDDSDDDPGAGGAGPTTAKSNTKRTSSSSSKPKLKPATFNLPWSTEEQHHLGQLLEEISAMAGFRWQQISRAMGGHRTPRQVASRVQKYFEKMKKCGLM